MPRRRLRLEKSNINMFVKMVVEMFVKMVVKMFVKMFGVWFMKMFGLYSRGKHFHEPNSEHFPSSASPDRDPDPWLDGDAD